MSRFKEGDIVRHVLDRDGETYEVVRVDEWFPDTILVVRNITGEYLSSGTFKIEADQARKLH